MKNWKRFGKNQGKNPSISSGVAIVVFYYIIGRVRRHLSVVVSITLQYPECLSHFPNGPNGSNLAQEVSAENLVRMRNGGPSGRRLSSRLAICLDLATTRIGSSLGLGPTSPTLTLKMGNRKG